MRITNSMMVKKFNRNLNSSMNMMDNLRDKVSTGRSFFKASENPVSAIKAYKLRREFRSTEMYQDNIRDVDSFLTTAESNLMGVSQNLESVYTSYLKGISGSTAKGDREIIAKDLENIQTTMLTTLNAKFEDKYIFGGTSTQEQPFTLGADGRLLYKGLDVDDPANKAELDKLSNEKMYVDLGMGLSFDKGNPNDLNKDTVFDMSMAGIKFLGYGGTKDDPKNVFNIIGKIKDELKSDDFSMEKIKPYITSFEKEKKNVLMGVTDIGSKTNYIDFLKLRTEDYQFNLNAKILAVEYIKPEEAIMELKMQEYSYKAALSMGNKILQPSFIDFMN